jgi:formate hydrogenlyase subunit 6/NADH:ubiquinone oxidoreductase subunit I
MEAFQTYFRGLAEGISSTAFGLKTTWQHLWDARKKNAPLSIQSEAYFQQNTGIVTLEYPYEAIPVPENGRYRLHNEMDDCIVCDKCAKVCPVNCIDIEPIKSTEEIGLTSDGTAKRLYAAKFDIDMAKCCYCGLCTTVCPTECLTMTQTFDYSEFDIRNMNYHFTNLEPEEAEEKKKLYEQKQAEKMAAKVATPPSVNVESLETETPVAKPVFKPKFPSAPKPPTTTEDTTQPAEQAPPVEQPASKPVFRPKMPAPKPKAIEPETEVASPINVGDAPKEQAVAKPMETDELPKPTAKTVFKPKIPGIKPKEPEATPSSDTVELKQSEPLAETPKAPEASVPTEKPVFKPKIPGIKPKTDSAENGESNPSN